MEFPAMTGGCAGRIVVGVDGSDGSHLALGWALEEAVVWESLVEAVTVWESPYDVPRELYYPVDEEKLVESARARLDEAIGEVTAGPVTVDIKPVVVEGDAADRLCEAATGADMLVVGSRGHGSLAGLLLGSVSSKCAQHSRVPVVIVREQRGHDVARVSQPASGRIVAGVDGSPGSMRALRWAAREAGARKARVEAVAVWRGTEIDDEMGLEWATVPSLARHDRAAAETTADILEDAVSRVAGESGVEVEPVLREGDPAEVLCRFAAGADMLVVGSHGHGALSGLLLGSVSTKCAHHSESPLVIVPADRDPAGPGPHPQV